MQIKKFILLACMSANLLPARVTIMLDPAGDAKNTGRIIDDTFERSVTLQLAEGIKKKLEADDQELRVILTRFPGQVVEPLQHANFANRLHIDLYFSLHAYKETGQYRQMYLYHYLHHPVTDYWNQQDPELKFIPHDQAHRKNAQKSKSIATSIKKFLSDGTAQEFTVRDVCGIPFKPLLGITAPAIGIEIGLFGKDDWHLYVDAVARAIEEVTKEQA